MRSSSRPWSRSPYKVCKWQQGFSELQAMETLRKRVVLLTQEHNPNTNFLSILIDCFHSYGSTPSLSAYSSVIKSLSQRHLFSQLSPLLDHLQKAESFEVPETVFVDLIRAYGKAGMLRDAIDVFVKVPLFRCKPSALSLNSLLSIVCEQKENLVLVSDLVLKSMEMRVRLESSTLEIMISALCEHGEVGSAMELLNFMLESDEYMADSRMYCRILRALCKDASSVEVMRFLDDMQRAGFSPSVSEYNGVISVLVRDGRAKDACSLLSRMKAETRRPDVVSYVLVLDGFISVDDFYRAEELFDEMLLMGIVPNALAYNSYINGLCKQGDLRRACRMVVCMEKAGCKPDLETFNILAGGYARAGEMGRMREVMNEMLEKGFYWNAGTYSTVIDGLLDRGETMEAYRYMMEMFSKGFAPQLSTFRGMICGFCEKGLLGESVRVLEEMVGRCIVPDATTWQTLLDSFKLSCEETPVHFDDIISV